MFLRRYEHAATDFYGSDLVSTSFCPRKIYRPEINRSFLEEG